MKAVCETKQGFIFQVIGDAFCMAFHTASDGLNAAVNAQEKLGKEDWGSTPLWRIRSSAEKRGVVIPPFDRPDYDKHIELLKTQMMTEDFERT